MIVTETVKIRGNSFIRNYSDKGVYIKKNGTDEVYSEAVDLPDIGYTYSETDIPIETDNEAEQIRAEQEAAAMAEAEQEV